MTRRSSGTIFESFNAKALTPEQVAETFVPPAFFEDLLKRRHSLIVGPRGSGKTTLLKMLQQPAIENWKHDKADEYADRMDFNSVFVPTDRRWRRQLDSLGEGNLDEDSKQLFKEAAFTTHVLRGLVITFINRSNRSKEGIVREHRRVALNSEDEEEIVRELASAWRIDPRIPSFLSLRQSLTRRLSEIRWLARREAEMGEQDRSDRSDDYDYLYLSFLDSAILGIELFNDAVGAPNSRWAFAFDELELAPDPVREDLTDAIRAADERILFKLALSPSSDQGAKLESALTAAPKHDYDPIRLWYVDRDQGVGFCKELWTSLLDDRNLPDLDPKEVLGQSYFESAGESAYEAESKWGNLFQKVASNDPTFRSYLEEKGVDPSSLSDVSGKDKPSKVRKIAPLLPLRDFYGKPKGEEGTERQFRSRKKPLLYTGATSLFAITEGNPRWFIGMFNSLLDKIDDNNEIKDNDQSDEIKKTAERFSALLRTEPMPTIKLNKKNANALDIIETISGYFAKKHIIDEFSADPPSTVRVNSNISSKLEHILRAAVNVGALVYVPDEDSEVLFSSTRGKRFRISYLLAPLYKLPVRLGRAVSLRTILRYEDSSETLKLEFGGDQ